MNDKHPFEPSREEIDRRYRNTRAAMADAGLDALIVSGSEYTGFEGAVRYMCGFHILHRYAYVLVPMEDEPIAVFPKEATWVGDHRKTFIERQEKTMNCGEWMAGECKSKGYRRVGIYGLNFIMPVRDYRALIDGGLKIIDFDEAFDYSRAVKSEEELRSIRHSMDINKAGVLAVVQAYEAGRTEAELMGVAEQLFTSMGTARNTMDMVLTGPNGSLRPQMVFPSADRRVQDTDGLLYGLEVAGQGGHWTEFSRLLAPRGISTETQRLMDAYEEFYALVEQNLKAGATADEVHRKCIKPFEGKGWRLGHVSGHSIGMTMIEFPRIGEGSEFVLPENMVCSLHPHVMTDDRDACLYFQDTFRVGANRGEAISGLPPAYYRGGESSL